MLIFQKLFLNYREMQQTNVSGPNTILNMPGLEN